MDWFRYGWRRWCLIRLCDYLPGKAHDRLLDFLYPDDMAVSFATHTTPNRSGTTGE